MDFKNIFEDNREEGSTQLQQCQLVMLRMLKILDYLCNKHSVEFFLVGGSLLGAIRHKGFIPWDDDLDVGMTRKNYKIFLKKVVPELPDEIFFQNSETDQFYPQCGYVEAKLRDKFSSYNFNKYKYHDGIQLDIFVYDKAFLPNNLFIVIQNFLLKHLLNSSKKRGQVLEWVANYFPLSLVYASGFLHTWGSIKLGANYIRPNEISSLQKVLFEDIEIPIPIGWENCLKRQYGDYLKLPPQESRKTHHLNLPNPFKPCGHSEIKHWEYKK